MLTGATNTGLSGGDRSQLSHHLCSNQTRRLCGQHVALRAKPPQKPSPGFHGVHEGDTTQK